MGLRFLIDECLTPELVDLAVNPDLVNQVLDVCEYADRRIEIVRYEVSNASS
jgi:hypothetical protein